MSNSEALAELKNRLTRNEETTGGAGAIPNTPKQMMLDASDVEASNPEFHFRFVNLRDPNKVRARQLEGYEIVPEAAGGKKLGGEMILMRIPRQKYDARIRRQDAMSKARLAAHTSEMEQIVESVARQLHDRYGLDIPTSRILVNETQ